MPLSSWPLARTSLSLGIGPWSSSGPPPAPAGATAGTLNLLPGYVVRSTRSFVSIDGTPFRPAANMPVLTDEGYYEIDVSNISSGLDSIRFQVCIVDPSTLQVGAGAPTSGEPPIFRTMAASLAAAYPKGKIAASSVRLDFTTIIGTNKAVALEIRKLSPDSVTYTKIGEALAKRAGTWMSQPFALDDSVADIKLAVVFASQSIVLG